MADEESYKMPPGKGFSHFMSEVVGDLDENYTLRDHMMDSSIKLFRGEEDKPDADMYNSKFYRNFVERIGGVASGIVSLASKPFRDMYKGGKRRFDAIDGDDAYTIVYDGREVTISRPGLEHPVSEDVSNSELAEDVKESIERLAD